MMVKYNPETKQYILSMDADEEHAIAMLGRDVGLSPWSYR